MRINVGVIFGGKSVEHEFSIMSAIDVMKNLDQSKYNPIPIYVDKDNNWWTGYHLKDILNYRDIALLKRYAKKVFLVKKNKCCYLQTMGLIKKNLIPIDIAFPVGHGAFLEDGCIQGYLEMLGIPYVGSGVLASSIGEDKLITKELLKSNNIPITNYVWFYFNDFIKNKKEIVEKIEELHYPLYVKAASLGSSIGIMRVNDSSTINSAIKNAGLYSEKIIVEEQVKNVKEVTISVLGDNENIEVSNISEINVESSDIVTNNSYLSKINDYLMSQYDKKYIKINDFVRKTKPLLSKEMKEDIKNYAISVFKIINATGVSKIDFLLDEKNRKIYISEIDTSSYFLASDMWQNTKKNKQELLNDLIEIAIKSKKLKDNLTLSFNGNFLEGFDVALDKK